MQVSRKDGEVLDEGEYGDVASDVRPDSGTGVLLSSKERREVLGRIGGGGGQPFQG